MAVALAPGHTLFAMQQSLALVTGASRGIGSAIARELSRSGVAVVLAARGLADCQILAQELEAEGGRARAIALDVTDAASIRAALGALEGFESELGPLSILVNNAGTAASQPLLAKDGASDELIGRLMAVNFDGARHLAEALLPGMKTRKFGRVVNVASSAGLRGYAYVSAYCATKFALVGWTLAAADEFQSSGVTFNAVCPHYVDTPMLARSIDTLVEKTGRTTEQGRAFFAEQNPGGRLVNAEEVARAVRALCEGNETGLLLELDGGDDALRHQPNQRKCDWKS
ncbi:MAG: 3-hydroxybutyrate dehydrogenase [Planctomycetota bacterium]